MAALSSAAPQEIFDGPAKPDGGDLSTTPSTTIYEGPRENHGGYLGGVSSSSSHSLRGGVENEVVVEGDGGMGGNLREHRIENEGAVDKDEKNFGGEVGEEHRIENKGAVNEDEKNSGGVVGGSIQESTIENKGAVNEDEKNSGGVVGGSIQENTIENEGAVNKDEKHGRGEHVQDTPRKDARENESTVNGHENHNAGAVGFPPRNASTNEVRRWIAAWFQSRALSHNFLEPSLANVAWNGEYMYEASAERMQWELAHWGFGNVYGQMIVRDILKERSRDHIPLIHRVKPTRRNICIILKALVVTGIVGAFAVIICGFLYFSTAKALSGIRNFIQM